MAFTGDSEWRRRMVEKILEELNRRNYERVGWDFKWKTPPWMNPPWPGQSSRGSRHGPVFDAVEERLRARSGRRAVDLLRYAYAASEEVRDFFRQADGALLERRAKAATEARRQREEAERERAREAVPAKDREAFAWVKAQAKLAEVAGQEWLRPWGVAENPAWQRTAAKVEALRPRPAPAVNGTFVMGFDPGDPRGDRAAYVFGRFIGGCFYVDHTGIVGDGL